MAESQLEGLRTMGIGARGIVPAERLDNLQLQVHWQIALLYRTLGDPAYAARLLSDLLHNPTVEADPYLAAQLRLDLAEALLQQNLPALAIDELRYTLPTFRAGQDKRNEARTCLLLGQAWLARQRMNPLGRPSMQPLVWLNLSSTESGPGIG